MSKPLAALFEEFRAEHEEISLDMETLRLLESGPLMSEAWTKFRRRGSDTQVKAVILGTLQAKNVSTHNHTVPTQVNLCERRNDTLKTSVKAFLQFADRSHPDLLDDKEYPDAAARIAVTRSSLIDLQSYLEPRYLKTKEVLLTKTPDSQQRSFQRATFGASLGDAVYRETTHWSDDFVAAVTNTFFPPPSGCDPDTANNLRMARSRKNRKAREKR